VVSFIPHLLYPLGTHWLECWLGLRTGPDEVEKRNILPLPRLELRPLSRPARSQSLYWLRYPGVICGLWPKIWTEWEAEVVIIRPHSSVDYYYSYTSNYNRRLCLCNITIIFKYNKNSSMWKRKLEIHAPCGVAQSDIIFLLRLQRGKAATWPVWRYLCFSSGKHKYGVFVGFGCSDERAAYYLLTEQNTYSSREFVCGWVPLYCSG
jgi:hypothetical protein